MNNSQSDPRLQALLSGYATGNLTEQEREELFTAALADQSLFDALLREEALRELVEQPGVRSQLLAAVSEPSLGARLAAWWRRPMAWGVTGAAAVATVVLVVSVFRQPEVRYSATVAGTPEAEIQSQVPVPVPDRAVAPAPETRAEPPLSASTPAPALKRERVASSSSAREKPQVRDSAVGEEKEKNEMAAAPRPPPPPPVEVAAGLANKDEQPVAQSVRPAPARAAAEADFAAPAAGPRLADERRRQAMAKTAAPASPANTQAPALQTALQVRDSEGMFAAASGLAGDSGTVRVSVVAPADGFVRMELRSGQNGAVRRVSIVPVSGGQTALVPSADGIAAGVGDLLSLQFARDARSFGMLAPGGAGPQGFRSGRGDVGGGGDGFVGVEIRIERLR